MAITESELREILDGEEDEGHRGGVTVAGVHRRARVIRRRRWTAAGAVAAVLTVAVALNAPASGVAGDTDVWTGVMAGPSPTIPTTSWPLGGPYPGEGVVKGEYTTGGTREELRIESGNGPLTVTVQCSGPMRRVIVWNGDGPPRLLQCGTVPDGRAGGILRQIGGAFEIPAEDRRAGGHVVSAVVLPGELREGESFEGWEERLAAARPFPLQWSLTVREMVFPVCRDNVRQLDPRTGEMVRLSCASDGGTPRDPAFGSS